MNTIPLADRPHGLYRFRDAAGTLLYIGITASLPTRLGDHSDKKPWWTEVASITVEHYLDRASVLAAERAAIIAERPRHNIVHNRSSLSWESGTVASEPVPDGTQNWTYTARTGHTRTGPLYLTWSINGDSISENHDLEHVSIDDLWRTWLRGYGVDRRAEAAYGLGAIRILWSVNGSGVGEWAPFQSPDLVGADEHFLTHYTWPLSGENGLRLRWGNLPVNDMRWNLSADGIYASSGGFLQELTGWKPSPLQPFVNIRQLAGMSGLPMPHASARGVAA